MPTDFFGPDVAATYDADDDPRFSGDALAAEVDFLADLAGDRGSALELAIGTGRVALPLRERGIDVHGVDLSSAMVGRLRDKPGGADVPVRLEDYAEVRIGRTFDLVYLVFNTLGNVITQDAQLATFETAAMHLRPGGHFVVEIGVPPRPPPGGRFVVFDHSEDHTGHDEYDAATQAMWSHHATRHPDGSWQRRSIPFRAIWPSELDLMARIAGLEPAGRWEWWDHSPFTAESGSHVSSWRRPG